MRAPNTNSQTYMPPFWLTIASLAGIVMGLVGLAITFVIKPADAWAWLVVNFVYFVGITNGVLAWAVVFRTTQTRWTPAIGRLAQSCLAYAPVTAVVLIVLLAGARSYLPWVAHPVPAKAAWLNVPFMSVRDIVALALFWGICFLLTRWSLAADAKRETSQREHYRMNVAAAAGVIVYAATSTIISWDFIMSLSPKWTSTVFGPYFFCTNIYAGAAVLILLSAALRKPLGVEKYIGPQQFQDLGNLMLGFCLFTMGLFYAQYLTIWYENLPEETEFLIVRYLHGEFPYLGWAAFIIGYALPFILLQSKHLKRHPKMLAPVCVMALLGVALERYVLVVPSLDEHALLLYPAGILISLGFLGAFLLCITLFLRKYRPVSSADVELKQIYRESTAP